jgi:hypothetical protein
VDWDGQNGLTMVIFQPGKQPDATKLTTQEITNFVARGDIKRVADPPRCAMIFHICYNFLLKFGGTFPIG